MKRVAYRGQMVNLRELAATAGVCYSTVWCRWSQGLRGEYLVREPSSLHISPTDAQRMRELIMCPLVKCYPAAPPKLRRASPVARARQVWIAREKTRRWLASPLEMR